MNTHPNKGKDLNKRNIVHTLNKRTTTRLHIRHIPTQEHSHAYTCIHSRLIQMPSRRSWRSLPSSDDDTSSTFGSSDFDSDSDDLYRKRKSKTRGKRNGKLEERLERARMKEKMRKKMRRQEKLEKQLEKMKARERRLEREYERRRQERKRHKHPKTRRMKVRQETGERTTDDELPNKDDKPQDPYGQNRILLRNTTRGNTLVNSREAETIMKNYDDNNDFTWKEIQTNQGYVMTVLDLPAMNSYILRDMTTIIELCKEEKCRKLPQIKNIVAIPETLPEQLTSIKYFIKIDKEKKDVVRKRWCNIIDRIETDWKDIAMPVVESKLMDRKRYERELRKLKDWTQHDTDSDEQSDERTERKYQKYEDDDYDSYDSERKRRGRSTRKKEKGRQIVENDEESDEEERERQYEKRKQRKKNQQHQEQPSEPNSSSPTPARTPKKKRRRKSGEQLPATAESVSSRTRSSARKHSQTP